MKSTSLFLIISILILSGCSSLNYELHEDPYAYNLKDIELKECERVLVLEQTTGFIWGGYFPGVGVRDPNIVKVENVEDGRTTKVYIQGRNVGETTLFYTSTRFTRSERAYEDDNKMQNIKEESEEVQECTKCFKVKVVR